MLNHKIDTQQPQLLQLEQLHGFMAMIQPAERWNHIMQFIPKLQSPFSSQTLSEFLKAQLTERNAVPEDVAKWLIGLTVRTLITIRLIQNYLDQ